MKKLSLVLVIAVVLVFSSLGSFAFAEPIPEIQAEDVNGVINNAGDTAMKVAKNILDQLTVWSLPFCAMFIVWGAVLFFIMGIRNLYKKRQGLLLMFGSMTFYVIILGVDLILNFLIG